MCRQTVILTFYSLALLSEDKDCAQLSTALHNLATALSLSTTTLKFDPTTVGISSVVWHYKEQKLHYDNETIGDTDNTKLEIIQVDKAKHDSDKSSNSKSVSICSKYNTVDESSTPETNTSVVQ